MLLKDPWSNSQAINGIINVLIDKKSETYEQKFSELFKRFIAC